MPASPPLCRLRHQAPANPDNLCEIFREKPKWHEAALKMQQRWGAPVQVPMAMMYQGIPSNMTPCRRATTSSVSSPWGRVRPAYGYAQAKTRPGPTTSARAGGRGRRRDDFADALDFMGWYIQRASGSAASPSGTPTAST
ncbi:hypothetical protein P4056_12560 [Pseudomonas aeruginosa]|nr:hypothetical protein [Pseudomonas aeruginosa]